MMPRTCKSNVSPERIRGWVWHIVPFISASSWRLLYKRKGASFSNSSSFFGKSSSACYHVLQLLHDGLDMVKETLAALPKHLRLEATCNVQKVLAGSDDAVRKVWLVRWIQALWNVQSWTSWLRLMVSCLHEGDRNSLPVDPIFLPLLVAFRHWIIKGVQLIRQFWTKSDHISTSRPCWLLVHQ